MEPFKIYEKQIRTLVVDAVPHFWPSLISTIAVRAEPAFPDEVFLPLMGAEVVKGRLENVLHICAIRLLHHIALGLMGGSTETIKDSGQAFGAWNIASGLIFRAEMNHHAKNAITNALQYERQLFLAGQELEFSGIEHTIEDYFKRVGMHTASRFATALVMGAMTFSPAPALIDKLGNYGHHLGIVYHLREQYHYLLHQPSARNISLPLLWAKENKISYWPNLQELIRASDIAGIKRLLVKSGAPEILKEAIAKEVEQGLTSLESIGKSAKVVKLQEHICRIGKLSLK